MIPTRLKAKEVLAMAGYYPGEVQFKVLPDGRIAWIARLLFTWAILVAGMEEAEIGYEDRWCFTSETGAEAALEAWSGEKGTEPEGWIRNPKTGRRRPLGDKAGEYVNF